MTTETNRHQRQQDFLARLRRAVRASGLQGKELAARLGLSASSVSGWLKHGAMPGADVMIELPYILGVSADYLLSGRGDAPAKEGRVPVVEYVEGALDALGDVEMALREVESRWTGKRKRGPSAAAQAAGDVSGAVAQAAKTPRKRLGSSDP